jgi:hypothetical protein
MNANALREPVSKLKESLTDCTLSGQTFVCLPFAGGVSAFAVILPKPMETGHGMAVTRCRKNQQQFSKISAQTSGRR